MLLESYAPKTVCTSKITSPSTQSVPPLRAVEEIRRMRGGCQSHLMRCSDGNHYVVKFPNNPQGKRVLANELLCTRLANLLSLPSTEGAVILVIDDLIRLSEEMCIETARTRVRCESGNCFGSRYPVDLRRNVAYDFLASADLKQVRNLRDFCGMLVFDTWTANADSRQVVFVRDGLDSHRALMIDYGLCFGGESWTLREGPRRGTYLDSRVYEDVSGIEAFEPWLSILEEDINRDTLEEAASHIPPEWYAGDSDSLESLLIQLHERKDHVRNNIHIFGASCPSVFPNWKHRAFGASA